MAAALSAIERLVSHDPGRRNIAELVQPDHLHRAAKALIGADRVAIVSGFYIPAAKAGETDGPPGAKVLGDALTGLGIPVSYVTDAVNLPLFEALGADPVYLFRPDILDELRPSHMVAVERIGRSRDGRYYNMRGEDLTPHVEPLDELFLQSAEAGIVTIGIGDGGNEVGMGRVEDDVRRCIHLGERIACTVATDWLIVAGTSNWGAYGLAGAMSLEVGRDLLPSVDQAREAIMQIVAAGAVDGVTLRKGPTVDGLELEESWRLLESIRGQLSG